jgi:spoIIIJ-associated protein
VTDTSTNPVESEETPAEESDETSGAETATAEAETASTDIASGESEGGEEKPAKDADSLFGESEIAADYIEGLLDILDYDGDIDELVQAGRPVVELVGDGLDPLVGQRGATLEALQELARLAVFRETGSPSRLLIDVGGFRQARRKELAAIAKNAVEKIREHGEPITLDAMTAFERKCVHDVVNELSDVESESEGVEPNRRVVVRPVG